MFANMLKSLIENGRIETTIPKAKALKRHADKMITLAKLNTLASRRRAVADLMVRYNALTSQEQRKARNGDISAYNTDRQVIEKLFAVLGPRFASREGGYTRIIKTDKCRVGDGTQLCFIEYLED
jgi:large subunit ribosomal protein L17